MSFNDVNPYKRSPLGSVVFSKKRFRLSDFFDSEKYFFSGDIMSNCKTVLDVGCSSGGLGAALKEAFGSSVQYTGIDVDQRAIGFGLEHYKNIKLISGVFPDDLDDKKYDMVTVFNLFEQIPEWKPFLSTLVAHSNRYLNIGMVLRLNGLTVIDKDSSYGYYYDSGLRVYKIVHNIYEIVNYCCLEELNVKKISFYGYTVDRSWNQASDFRPLPQREQIRGNLLLELHDSETTVKRYGGFSQNELTENVTEGIELVEGKPEVNLIINGEEYDL